MNFTSLANQFVCDVPVYEPGRPIEEVARETRFTIPEAEYHNAAVEPICKKYLEEKLGMKVA